MALRPYFLFNPLADLEDGINIPEEVLDDTQRWFDMIGGRRHEIKYWDPIDAEDFPALAEYLEMNNGGGAVPVLITWW